jgi:alpha-D-xyloside xylohydrolase
MRRRGSLSLLVSIVASCSPGGERPGTDQADVSKVTCTEPNGAALATRAFGDVRVNAFTSGHLEIVGPGRHGATARLILSPMTARLSGGTLGASIVAATEVPEGIDLELRFGSKSAKATVRARADGVVRVEVIDWGGDTPSATTVAARTDTSEHFYGFGEKFDAVDQAGRKVGILAVDHPGAKGDASYKVAPWFVSNRGYGFHLDGTAESAFDMRASSSSCWTATNDFKTLAFNVVWGPELGTVLERYTAYSGRPSGVPFWAFGPWISSDIWKTGGEVRMVVDTMRRLKVPGSVFVFDSPWSVSYNDFRFNMGQFGAGASLDVPVVDDLTGAWTGAFERKDFAGFASQAEMMQFLRSNGYHVVVWMTPFVNTESFADGVPGQNLGKSPTYDDGAALGAFVTGPNGDPLRIGWWKGVGSPVDFTSAAGKAWFVNQLARLVDESGGVVSGFKTDDGESRSDAPTHGQSGIYIPDTARYADGRTGVEMKNGYTLEYQRAVHGVLGDNGVVLARSGFAGTQAFPGVWAGDNASSFDEGDGLPTAFIAAQSAAMSGYALWGSDIGGYVDVGPFAKDNPSPSERAEMQALFMRWTELGALSPVMEMHRKTTHHRQYPWSFGPRALSNYRSWASFHTRLAPYLATMMKAATDTGMPIIRPLVLLDADNPATHSLRFVFGLGSELVVAPVNANITSRSITMPSGVWFDFATGARFDGGRDISVDADLEQAPIFVRAGGIVPMLLETPQTLADRDYAGDVVKTPSDGLSILVVPSGTARALTLPDGTTVSIVDPQTLIVDGKPRVLELRILAKLRAVDAGVPVELTQKGAFAEARLAHPGGAVTVHLTPLPGAP